MASPGYVYALINPSMPGLVKVGRTERDPTIRVSELSGVTGVATPFILIFHQAFEDCALAERHAHAILERHGKRFSANREFFETEPTVAIHAILKSPGAVEEVPIAKASDQKEKKSQISLLDEMVSRARKYVIGYGDTPKDVKECIKLLEKAGKLGSAKAYFELGDIYLQGAFTKKNETKAFENYRLACEMHYALAWAKTAMIRQSDDWPYAEAQAWRKFFSIALTETFNKPLEGENAGDFYLIVSAASGFLNPRPKLKLGYDPISAKLDDELLTEAVDFMKRHVDAMVETVDTSINDVRSRKETMTVVGGKWQEYGPKEREAEVAEHQKILRWLHEL